MSATIIQLEAKRAPHKERIPDSVLGPRYFCLKCNGDQFNLHESCRIRCASCQALIGNLVLVIAKGQA